MNFRCQVAVVGSVFMVPALTHCSSQAGTGNASSSNMSKMNNGGAALTAVLPPQPQEGDDTPSFANDIQPIFDERCTRCHNPVQHTGGLDLTSGNSYDMLVNHPTSDPCMQEVPGSVRVATCDTPPCDPSQSMIWSKTMPDARAPDGTRCLQPMPLGTPGLGVICPDQFQLLESWIIAGAPNN
jgi:hypothetical protein